MQSLSKCEHLHFTFDSKRNEMERYADVMTCYLAKPDDDDIDDDDDDVKIRTKYGMPG